MRTVATSLAIAATLSLTGTASAASTFFLRGGGFGHGIGMSQYGAYGYALHGKDYRFILAHYYQGTSLAATNPNRVVRVLLHSGSAAFSGATQVAGKQLNPAMTYSVRALGDGSLTIQDSSGKVVGRFWAPLQVAGRGPLKVAGLGAYRGALRFRPNGAGGVYTVDVVKLDDYVRGVISAEMPAGWAPEALKVQAVAARTYAITTNVAGSFFDLYPDTRSQMYRGVAAETPASDAAVTATRNQVVSYRGVPVVTYFSASSGGYTENIENVWSGATPEPWLRGVPDPYDDAAGNPYDHRGYDLSPGAAAARLGGLVKGSLIGIRVIKHGASPRILSADVVGTGGSTRVSGGRLQSAFGMLTTYMVFTTISTSAGPGSAPKRTVDGTKLSAAMVGIREIVSAVPFLHGLLDAPRAAGGPVKALHGTVFPVSKGAAVSIQQRVGGGWRTVVVAKLSASGAFSGIVAKAGTYRAVYRGLNGPAVGVS